MVWGSFLSIPIIVKSKLGLFSGIPNTAAGVFVFEPSKQLRNNFVLFDKNITQINPSLQTAIVILSSPIETGLLVYTPNSADLTHLVTTQLPTATIAPVALNMVAVGSPSFIERVKASPKVPWVISIRLWFQSKLHHGVFLWGPDNQLPWTIGQIDSKDDKTYLTIPTSELSDNFLANVKEFSKRLFQELYPTIHTIQLPDKTTAKEVKASVDTQDDIYFQEKTTNVPCFAIEGLEGANNLAIFTDKNTTRALFVSFLLKQDKVVVCF